MSSSKSVGIKLPHIRLRSHASSPAPAGDEDAWGGDHPTPTRKTHKDILEERKRAAEAAMAEAEAGAMASDRRGFGGFGGGGGGVGVGGRSEPILKWKAGTAEIEMFKQERVGAGATMGGGAVISGTAAAAAAATMAVRSGITSVRGGRVSSPSITGNPGSEAGAAGGERGGGSAGGGGMASPPRGMTVGGSSSLADEGYGILTEEGMPPPEDDITSRLLSLPNIVCKVCACAADLFTFLHSHH